MHNYVAVIINRGDLETLKALYASNPNCYDPSDAMVVAASQGDLDMVRYLVEKRGADVNHEMEIGTADYPETEDALSNAIESGNRDLLRYLLARCDPEIVHKMDALRTACSQYELDVIKILHEHFRYTAQNLTNALANYVRNKYDAADDPLTYLPNYQAAEAIIRYLLSQGANINTLVYAQVADSEIICRTIHYGNMPMMRLLLKFHAIIPEAYYQTRLLEIYEGRTPNECELYLLQLRDKERLQRDHYARLLEELKVQPSRNGFPGGQEYRLSRERMIDQGMIDIISQLKTVSVESPNELQPIFTALNISRSFSSPQTISQYLQEYLTMM